jgi:ABC-type Fe3+ transport system permease subunit
VFVRNAQEVGLLSEASGLSTLPYYAQGSSDSESVHDADPLSLLLVMVTTRIVLLADGGTFS